MFSLSAAQTPLRLRDGHKQVNIEFRQLSHLLQKKKQKILFLEAVGGALGLQDDGTTLV